MAYEVDDRVRVRMNEAAGWRTGTVTSVDAMNGQAYEVTLDSPVTANAWAGRTRRLAGNAMVNVVLVGKNQDALAPGTLIVPIGA